MQIEILDYVTDIKGTRLGFIDVKFIYPNDKWEIFRGIAYFNKRNNRWLSFPKVKRGDKWIPIYERQPNIASSTISLIIKALDEYIDTNPLLTDLMSTKQESLCMT